MLNACKDVFDKHRFFIGFLIILWIGVGITVQIFGKNTIHYTINSWNTGFFDYFFKYLTHFADGVFAFAIAVVIFIKNKYKGLYIGIANLLAGATTQILKKTIFSDALRPVMVLKNLHLVDGLDIHKYHSFPSGHATTAFCLYIGLLLLTNDAKWKMFFMITAILTAFSRVYLSQHFITDILAGSLIGSLFAIFVFCFFKKKSYL